MKRLLTPLVGTTLYAMGATLTGGRDYVLVSESDAYASNLVLNQKLSALATGEKMVLLPEEANLDVLKGIVQEYIVSKPWNPTEESYEDFIGNAYRYAAEAYSSELEGEGEEAPKAKTSRAKAAAATQEEKPTE